MAPRKPLTDRARRREREHQRRVRAGWCVFLSDPAAGLDGSLVEHGLSEDEARALSRRKNEALNLSEGVATKLPCRFYFAEHGNYCTGEKDRGLNAWIDGEEAPPRKLRTCRVCRGEYEPLPGDARALKLCPGCRGAVK